MKVTMISRGVEISIAGGVAETEDANDSDCLFSFFFLFCFLSRLLIISIVANAHLCSSHSPRYNGLSAKRGSRSPKPPTTVHPAIPKLKPADPA